MDVKELLKMPSDELRANVQVCLEHSCAIFLGNYGLCKKEEEYIKSLMNLEKDEPNESDLEFKAALDVFQTKINSLQSIWHSIGPVKMGTSSVPSASLSSVLLGIIQAFEMSEVPPIIPAALEALVTGQWKNFVLSAAGLMSPSGMKIEVIREIITYLIDEDFWEWCKRNICEGKESPSFNLYVNQTVKPLEKLLREAPET
jgi:hypothetical protein